jgi:hypothetical protein
MDPLLLNDPANTVTCLDVWDAIWFVNWIYFNLHQA